MIPNATPNTATDPLAAPGLTPPPPTTPTAAQGDPPACDGLRFAQELPPRRLYSPEEAFEAGLRQHHLATTAYPIAHRRTIWGYRVGRREEHPGLLARAVRAAEGFCLYAHIPFCERRCKFCEYCVLERHDAELEAAYHRALLQELDQVERALDGGAPPLEGFDIGGGTPSLIDPARIAELVERVRRAFSPAPGFQISIETTPRLAALHPERVAAYRRLGIQRISMGLQTVNPRLLRRYGRKINGAGYNQRAVDSVRRAGFESFNIDLMYGLAAQGLDDFVASLGHTVDLAPDHITLYRMRYKGTRISEEADQVGLARVTRMYSEARALLAAAGYRAAPGKNTFSRLAGDSGASAYLTARVVRSVPYLGLGLGAQSFTNNALAYNLGAASKRPEAYLRRAGQGLPVQDLYHLPQSEGMAKMISVAFYFGGVDLGAFARRFGAALTERFAGEVALLRRRGLVTLERGPGGRPVALRMTEAGAKVPAGVLALFYSPRVREHLVTLGRPEGR